MTQQLACTYAALMLHDSGKLDADNILAVTKAAGVDVSVGMAHAFANALATINIEDVIAGMTFSGGAGAATSAAAGGAAAAASGSGAGDKAAPAAEAKKEEPAEEEDDDMGFGLFD